MNGLKRKKELLHPHTIRFPKGMYRELGEMSERERRTFNAQVIYLIQVGMETIASQKGKAEGPPPTS